MSHPTEGSSCSVWSVDALRDPPMVIIQKFDSVLIKNRKTPTISYMCAAVNLETGAHTECVSKVPAVWNNYFHANKVHWIPRKVCCVLLK